MFKKLKYKTIIFAIIVAIFLIVVSFFTQEKNNSSKVLPVLAKNHSNTKLVYESEFAYRSLTPTALTTKKGIHIFGSDNLQYTRGSLQGGDGSGVVYENFDPHNGSAEFWVRTNFASTDANTHYILDASAAVLYWDGANTQWKATVNSINITKADTFSAGDWTYILLTWTNKASDTLDLEVDGSSATQVTTAQTSGTPSATIYIGQNSSSANIFNGVIAGRILNNIITSNYSAGAGSLNTFTATPDTVWLGTYSDSDTDAIFQHRGQQVSTTDADTVNLAQAVGSRSWKDNDRVAVWDGTGYKVEGLINEPVSIATTDTSLELDGLSPANLANVGRSLDFDALRYAQAANNTIHDITTQDIGISAWVRVDSDAPATSLAMLTKGLSSGNSRWRFSIISGTVGFIMTDADGESYQMLGNTDIRDNKWHQVGVIIDRDNAANSKIYLDGYEDGTTNKTGTLALIGSLTNSQILMIGTFASLDYKFDGQIRDVILAYPADIMAANEMGASGEMLTLATTPRDLTTVNSEDSWALNDNAATTVVVGAVNNLTASANTDTFDSQEAFLSKNLIADGGMEQGGIGAWTAGDAATTLAKDTTTFKFDTRSLKITNGDASQAFARQTITTAAGEDYRFHGWFYAPATPNGASQLVDVDGTAALGITVTQAGATVAATWYEVDFSFEAADASTTIDLGSGSATNAEIGYWDNVKVQKNLVNKGGMEGTYVAGVAPGWALSSSGGSVASDTGRTGTLAQSITGGTGTFTIIGQTVSLTEGKYYTITFWAKKSGETSLVGAADGVAGSWVFNMSVTSTGWAKYSKTFKYNASDYPSGFRVSLDVSRVTGDILYADDVSLIELDQDDPTTTGAATKGDGHYPRNNRQIQPF